MAVYAELRRSILEDIPSGIGIEALEIGKHWVETAVVETKAKDIEKKPSRIKNCRRVIGKGKKRKTIRTSQRPSAQSFKRRVLKLPKKKNDPNCFSYILSNIRVFALYRLHHRLLKFIHDDECNFFIPERGRRAHRLTDGTYVELKDRGE